MAILGTRLPSWRIPPRRRQPFLLAGWGLLLLSWMTAGNSGCASSGSALPTPGELAALGPLAPGVSEAILRDGRTLLITECARCHRRRLPHEYAIAKWEEVLRGGHRAALSPPQVDALLTYIRETQRLQPPPMNTQK